MKTRFRSLSLAKLFVLLIFGLLAACKPSLEIELIEPARIPSPAFRIVDPSRPDEIPQFTSVSLMDPQGKILWNALADVPGVKSGAREVVYGQAPQGFTTVEGPPVLEVGTSYVFEARGIAYGQLRFKVSADGVIKKED